MTRAPRQPDQYPADGFWNDIKRIKSEAIVGGWHGTPDQLTLKLVLPAFETQEMETHYRVQVLLVLSNTNVSQDIAKAINTRVTLKGVGNPKLIGRALPMEQVAQVGKIATDQMIGIGGTAKLLKSVVNAFRGINESDTRSVMLGTDAFPLGRVSVGTKLLTGLKGLKNGPFAERVAASEKSPLINTTRAEFDPSLDKLIISDIQAKFTKEEVARILEVSNNVPKRYGGKPRLILRIDYPEPAFYPIGNNPSGAFLIANQDKDLDRYEHEYRPIKVDSVKYGYVEEKVEPGTKPDTEPKED